MDGEERLRAAGCYVRFANLSIQATHGVEMTSTVNLDQARLKQVLNYDPLTGVFTRLEAPGNRTDLIGSTAGSPNRFGYIRISVDARSYLAHRLAFLFMTGSWPAEVVDHVNGHKGDNRWSNLRQATQAQNLRNRSTGRGGVPKNVYSDGNKWVVRFNINGAMKSYGSYATLAEAAAVATKVRADLHGEFANHN